MSDANVSRRRPLAFTQEGIVFFIFLLAFAGFSIFLKGFFTVDNIGSLLQNVAILGILGVAMGLVIIGRGIDLAIVSVMAITMAWSITLMDQGYSPLLCLLAGLVLALIVGAIQGVLIAYVEIPAIFATLAMSSVVYGFGRIVLIDQDIIHLSVDVGGLRRIGTGMFLGVPTPVVLLGLTALAVFLILRNTKPGIFIRSMGDNPLRARIAGMPVRPLIVLEYMISSGIGCLGGLIMAMLVGSMNTRIVNSTMVYDVVLVVVLGGIGLSGGKGGVRNVLVGTLLLGTVLNGMTILDVPYTIQNIIKGLILLIAITADSIVNPRDEQTSQQGDI
ncbi:MAG: ABC transporter permease [Roseiarcus sp.]